MNLAASNLKTLDGSGFQCAHHRLTVMLSNGQILPCFTTLARRADGDGQNKRILPLGSKKPR